MTLIQAIVFISVVSSVLSVFFMLALRYLFQYYASSVEKRRAAATIKITDEVLRRIPNLSHAVSQIEKHIDAVEATANANARDITSLIAINERRVYEKIKSKTKA